MPETPPPIDRRTALRTLAAAGAAGLAGCSNGSSGGGSATPAGSSSTDGTGDGSRGIIEDLSVTATDLVVSIAETDATVTAFLVNDAGEQVQSSRIQAGTQTRLPLLSTGWIYTPGEYTVVVKDGDEALGRTSIELQPDLELRGVGLVRNHPEIEWVEEVLAEKLIFADLVNRGTGPAAVESITMASEPVDQIGEQRGKDLEGWITNVGVPVSSDERKFVRNLTSVFSGYNKREATGRQVEFTVRINERLTETVLSTSGSANFADNDDDGSVERVEFEFENPYEGD